MEFQSTRPVKDATPSTRRLGSTTLVFQSTRPVKDATPADPDPWLARLVSIHASREGRDPSCHYPLRLRGLGFNPRVP